jgi:hypothetical protein
MVGVCETVAVGGCVSDAVGDGVIVNVGVKVGVKVAGRGVRVIVGISDGVNVGIWSAVGKICGSAFGAGIINITEKMQQQKKDSPKAPSDTRLYLRLTPLPKSIFLRLSINSLLIEFG